MGAGMTQSIRKRLALAVGAGLARLCSPAALQARLLKAFVRLAGFRAKKLKLADGVLGYRECGQGPPVLLLHGFGGNGLINWFALMPGLSRHYRVIVPDLLWFGASTASRPPSLVAQGEALVQLIEHLNLQSVQVVGVSYGGLVALEVARQGGPNVHRLVLINSPGLAYGEPDIDSMLERAGAANLHELFIPRCARDVERVSRLVCNNLPPIPDFLLEDIRRHYYVGREHHLSALINDLVGKIPEHKHRFRVVRLPPTVLIWGEKDRVFPLELGQKLAKHLHAPLLVVPRVGHNLPVEAPRETLALLLGVLSDRQSVAQIKG
jgi:pimeloyl-ACP methyl ester carboxylesterase